MAFNFIATGNVRCQHGNEDVTRPKRGLSRCIEGAENSRKRKQKGLTGPEQREWFWH